MTEKEKARLRTLADQYLKNTISEKERAELEAWFREQHDEPLDLPADFAESEAALEQRIFRTVQARTGQHRTIKLWPRIAAAASVLILLGVGAYFLVPKKAVQRLAQNDVAPFSKPAILKTGHGKTLQLDSTQKGLLARYANTSIQASGDAVAYSDNKTGEPATVFDTLQVPAGGRPYHLQLADGSQVIVNVASLLRFPENFRKNNSQIELIAGEAYFSIVHNARAPLTIKAKGQLIEDVGTEFDVNTYQDEPDSRTTLVEGAITVNHKNLQPGQQAIIASGSFIIAKADIEQVTAWKNGYFRFKGEHIDVIMRQLARWYDIEVAYQGKKTDEVFYGKITRKRNISEVLKMLEKTQKIHFKLEGRRVTVLSKT